MAKEKKAAKASVKPASGFYESVERWLNANDKRYFGFLIILCAFLSFISFNARISEAHDDALYLEGGWRYVHEFPEYFYTQNAPLYPMFLALLIKIMGFRLIVFKVFSMLFTLCGLALFYRALRGRIPAVIFIPVTLFHAANHLILYYASMTFTEAFYFFLQGLFFFYAAKISEEVFSGGVQIRGQLKLWLMLGLSLLLISTAKSAAMVAVPAVILYFLIYRNGKAAFVSLAAYLAFKIPYEIIVRSVWKAPNQFKGQSRILLQKDPYNAALGNEDLSGFVQRFFDNCNLYLSKRFYQLLGWRDELNTEVYGFLAFITIALALLGFWLLYKQKNRYMVLLALFTGAQVVLSFVILQARWDQARIILVCMPILLALMLYAFYHLTRQPGVGQALYATIALLMMISVIMSSFKRGLKNIPVVQKNLKGDKYYGYTPDWINFLKCSEWCADNLPDTAYVASRKAPMSFVYGKGKKFFPVYSVVKKDTDTNQSQPDSALAYFRQNRVTHVMLPSLRLDPNNASAGIINTMHNILAPIAQKYPQKLKVVHVEGDYEQCYLYELKY